MTDPLDLLRQQQAETRSQFARNVERDRSRKPRLSYSYVGYNADTGRAIVQGSDGAILSGGRVTSGAIQPGQSVCVRSSGGVLQIDQMPHTARRSVEEIPKPKTRNIKYLYGIKEPSVTDASVLMWSVYVGGWEQDKAVLVKQIAIGSGIPSGFYANADPVITATIDNLSGDDWNVNLAYWTSSSSCVFERISNRDPEWRYEMRSPNGASLSYSYALPSGVYLVSISSSKTNTFSPGHGFWQMGTRNEPQITIGEANFFNHGSTHQVQNFYEGYLYNPRNATDFIEKSGYEDRVATDTGGNNNALITLHAFNNGLLLPDLPVVRFEQFQSEVSSLASSTFTDRQTEYIPLRISADATQAIAVKRRREQTQVGGTQTQLQYQQGLVWAETEIQPISSTKSFDDKSYLRRLFYSISSVDQLVAARRPENPNRLEDIEKPQKCLHYLDIHDGLISVFPKLFDYPYPKPQSVYFPTQTDASYSISVQFYTPDLDWQSTEDITIYRPKHYTPDYYRSIGYSDDLAEVYALKWRENYTEPPMDNVLQLLRDRQSLNRLQFAQNLERQRQQQADRTSQSATYLGFNADTGKGIFQTDDGGTISAQVITPKAMQPGQQVLINSNGSVNFADGLH